MSAKITRIQTLRARAAELERLARQAEVAERADARKRRNRAAFILGGFLLRHQPEAVSAILGKLSERDRLHVTTAFVHFSTASQPIPSPNSQIT